MPSYTFDHIHLLSPDPAKTAQFYEKMFGAKQISKIDLPNGRTMVNLSLNGTTILVSPQRANDTRIGLDHYGIRTDNLEKAVSELKAQGVPFTQDIREVRPGFKISFLSAPDSVTIELQEGSL